MDFDGCILRHWPGQDNWSYIRRHVAQHMLTNRSRITGKANATTSTEASHMLHSLLGTGWQKSLGLPRLLDILEQDPAFEVRLLKPGERGILFKQGALRNLKQSARLEDVSPEIPIKPKSGSAEVLAWDPQVLQRAVDHWWPDWDSRPEQFLKHALAAHLASLRQGSEEVVRLDTRTAGKQQLEYSYKTSCSSLAVL